MLNLVDFYGTSFIVFILTIGEIVAVCWIYGKHKCFFFMNFWFQSQKSKSIEFQRNISRAIIKDTNLK